MGVNSQKQEKQKTQILFDLGQKNRRGRTAYFFDAAATQIAAIQNALAVKAPPVREHLKAALALLSDKAAPDYRNSIKESVSAVEAACREMAGVPKATLGDALKKISGVHPAMSKGFSNLYGYTNDADGIRHALLEESDLTKDDALFMLVACSAFVGFLYGKGKAASKKA